MGVSNMTAASTSKRCSFVSSSSCSMTFISRVTRVPSSSCDFFNVPLTPIKENDGIVSCKLLGTWPNRTKVTVEIVATGEAKVATVRDANEFHLYDIFDARDYGREIQWTAELNNATY